MTVAQTVLPRWRGFNLLELFWHHAPPAEFSEEDFRWIADWGFDFVRLPMNYRHWINDGDVYSIRESTLEMVDRALTYGERYRIHICLNFHNAPGYCINPAPQPFNLWKDAEGEAAFVHHWQVFARRYQGISSNQLSFNLVNEPPTPDDTRMSRKEFLRIMQAGIRAIREIDPDRLIIIDGLSIANEPVPELIDLNVAQSCRAYIPSSISHYLAPWANGMNYPPPTWPERDDTGLSNPYNRAKLEAHYAQWADLARKGVGVHCGEGGAFIHTPHDVYLRWFGDVLDILTDYGIGYALWNLRGAFGILDSERPDVDYVDWHGHKLDQKLLALLQAH